MSKQPDESGVASGQLPFAPSPTTPPFFISQWWRDKAKRAEHYFRFRYGWKQRPCSACSGSGRYDIGGSPSCGACDGAGRETYRGSKWHECNFADHATHLVAIARMEDE